MFQLPHGQVSGAAQTSGGRGCDEKKNWCQGIVLVFDEAARVQRCIVFALLDFDLNLTFDCEFTL
jgi:hypothetical protein